MNRRDFIRSIFRNLIFSGILLMSGYLLFREKEPDNCSADFVCKKCKKLDNCTLPEAKEYKLNH